MKKIWIRSEISSVTRVVMSALFILIVLVAWFIVTTVRSPRETISSGDFERLISNPNITETDKKMLSRAYSPDASKGTYRINPALDNREKIMTFEIIVTRGYEGLNPLPCKTIRQADFERLLAILKIKEIDPIILLRSYSFDKAKNLYRINPDLDISERVMSDDMLVKLGYAGHNLFPNPIFSPNVLPNPIDILASFPSLISGTSEIGVGFEWEKSLFYAIWISLRRELIAFFLVILIALPLGVMMSSSNKVRSFVYPALVIGSFIPIAALIPLTLAFFGIGEEQKIIFLGLGMFFVLLGLVIKEIDEVDDILLNTAYTLGFSQLKTILFVIVPTALPRIWKHLAAVFGLGWGYIIFAEMINAGGDSINGIGWLFIARQRRFRVAEMFAIFFVIIFFAFFFSYLFKLGARVLFKYDKESSK